MSQRRGVSGAPPPLPFRHTHMGDKEQGDEGLRKTPSATRTCTRPRDCRGGDVTVRARALARTVRTHARTRAHLRARTELPTPLAACHATPALTGTRWQPRPSAPCPPHTHLPPPPALAPRACLCVLARALRRPPAGRAGLHSPAAPRTARGGSFTRKFEPESDRARAHGPGPEACPCLGVRLG